MRGSDHHDTAPAEKIATTVLRTPRSEFDKLREAFASHISQVFETPPAPITNSVRIIQDANIRLFYDGLSEAMGQTYAAFIVNAIMVPIPSINGVAVFVVQDADIMSRGASFARTRTLFDTRLAIINNRESPFSIWHADCQTSVRYNRPLLNCLITYKHEEWVAQQN